MNAKVFISCGQRGGERGTASAIAKWFEDHGFRPYVALEAQSVKDVNSGIISELRQADYYIFVDFRRERLGGPFWKKSFRGSLFSHQELAIAHAMKFEHALFFRQGGVRLEGLSQYMMSNAVMFEDRAALPAMVFQAVERRGWTPRYSRNLVVERLHFPETKIAFGPLRGRALHADIENRRTEVGAAGVVARLNRLRGPGTGWRLSPNPSPLKATGQRGFEQTIWPQSHGAVDLLFADCRSGNWRVFLNNALDIEPQVLFSEPGHHVLVYEAFAPGFDTVQFAIDFQLPVAGVGDTAILIDMNSVDP